MGNCALALAMKHVAWLLIVDTGLYKACCAQRCRSYAADECSNVVDARYWAFEETL